MKERTPWTNTKEDSTFERNTKKGKTKVCKKSLWYNVRRTDETKIEFFQNGVHQFLYRQQNKANKENNTLLKVKYSGSCIMLWGCFAASGTRGIGCIKGMMKSEG